MPAFFHHILRHGRRVEDLEGVDLPDIDAARGEAVAALREIASDDVRSGRPLDLRASIEIADETGQVVLIVPLADAVTIVGSD